MTHSAHADEALPEYTFGIGVVLAVGPLCSASRHCMDDFRHGSLVGNCQ